jgi:hypothetical protein
VRSREVFGHFRFFRSGIASRYATSVDLAIAVIREKVAELLTEQTT